MWKTLKVALILNNCEIEEKNSDDFSNYKEDDYRAKIFIEEFESKSDIHFHFKKVILFHTILQRNISISCLNLSFEYIQKKINEIGKDHLIFILNDYHKVKYSEFTSPISIIKNENLVSLILSGISGQLGKSVKIITDLATNYPYYINISVISDDRTYFKDKNEFEYNTKKMIDAVKENSLNIDQANLKNKYLIKTTKLLIKKSELKKSFQEYEILSNLSIPESVKNE